MLEFEWDEQKAAANYVKHGVRFAAASAIFRDPFAVDQEDRTVQYDEIRRIIIGMADGMILTIVYTERGDAIRIISARRATKSERHTYEDAD
jgi:uncharacterized DUF497 family protein